ncbi:hypothetical protein V6N11_020344 [Hibiscus sabdariffa]|uniref:Alliinase EGF-like domain-containing protein n=1 Tax=Hibiscus sabdariffa TaxID=183260 RepID=A0ABR2Q849_9ROSI
MVKTVLRSKYVFVSGLVSSILLNLLLIINNYAGAQWILSRGWSSRAAAEAEAVAEIGCSGHGIAYLDGFVGDGNEPVCECHTCYTGPDCSHFIPHCTANADGYHPAALDMINNSYAFCQV